MLNRKKLCVIVDGYSTGSYYVSRFIDKGYDCLHIQSNPSHPEWITCKVEKKLFVDTLIYENFDSAKSWVEKHGIPETIIPGCDEGVKLADKLSDVFKTPTANNIQHYLARRNKFDMSERIRFCSIRAVKQIKTKKLQVGLDWIHDEKLSFPIIVKPLESGSADGLFLCHDKYEFEKSFYSILENKNFFGVKNNEVLIQEFINGKEFVVNTVGRDGKHFVVNICDYEKYFTEEMTSVYRAVNFFHYGADLSSVLIKYAFSVLDALGVMHGPTHIEIMMDEKGPVLMEVGSRLAGMSFNPSILQKVFGYNQVDLSVLSYTDSEAFFKEAAEIQGKQFFAKNLTCVLMVSLKDGFLDEIDCGPIKRLESFFDIVAHTKPNQKIVKARNINDTIIRVYLCHSDLRILEKDKAEIERLEKSGKVIKLKR